MPPDELDERLLAGLVIQVEVAGQRQIPAVGQPVAAQKRREGVNKFQPFVVAHAAQVRVIQGAQFRATGQIRNLQLLQFRSQLAIAFRGALIGVDELLKPFGIPKAVGKTEEIRSILQSTMLPSVSRNTLYWATDSRAQTSNSPIEKR